MSELPGGPESRQVDRSELISSTRMRMRSLYGNDDRQEWKDVEDQTTKQSVEAVALVVPRNSLRPDGNRRVLQTIPLRSQFRRVPLCPNVRYADQPTAGSGSAFLVKQDVVVTAGHVVFPGMEREYRILFGFRMGPTQAVLTFTTDDVYEVRSAVHREAMPADWVALQLDRPVVGRSPHRLSRSHNLPIDTRVFTAGYPMGLPLKVAQNASVKHAGDATSFRANLDVFAGNSGSPVFNLATREVEGIVVSGAIDFVELNGCKVPLQCPAVIGAGPCTGEVCTRASLIAAKLNL
ncbi:MAG TPA: serine protease [Bryobacteraceae bacterium]|nr:serine protease [Bryobacteraceae bacterium]